MVKLARLVSKWLEWTDKTFEGEKLTVKNPLVFFQKSGRIVLTNGQRLKFNEKNKKDIFNLAFFIIEHDVRFGDKGFVWKIGPLDNKDQTEYRQDGTYVVETPNGIKVLTTGFDSTIFAETFLYDTHFSEGLDGKIVVQAGGFVGDTALYYASKGGVVYSFEPDPNSFGIAKRNIALNPEFSKRITFENYALGRSGMVDFPINEAGSGGASIYSTGYASKVRVKSLNISEIISEFNIHSPYLLDLDIKGSEFEIINDSAITEFKKIRIEYSPFLLNDNNKSFYSLVAKIRGLGFEITRIYKHYPERYDLTTHGTIEAINQNH